MQGITTFAPSTSDFPNDIFWCVTGIPLNRYMLELLVPFWLLEKSTVQDPKCNLNPSYLEIPWLVVGFLGHKWSFWVGSATAEANALASA